VDGTATGPGDGAARDRSGDRLEIQSERNKSIHSKWTYNLDGALSGSKFYVKAKHGLKRTFETWQPNRFISVAFHCGYLTHEIDTLMFALYGEAYGSAEDHPIWYKGDETEQ
jgi:hypothetical protein